MSKEFFSPAKKSALSRCKFQFKCYNFLRKIIVMQIILCTINCHRNQTAYCNAISFLFFFYGRSMESLLAINLCGQLMIWWYSVWSSNVFYVFLLWRSLKLMFQHYSIMSNSCFFQLWHFKKLQVLGVGNVVRHFKLKFLEQRWHVLIIFLFWCCCCVHEFRCLHLRPWLMLFSVFVLSSFVIWCPTEPLFKMIINSNFC